MLAGWYGQYLTALTMCHPYERSLSSSASLTSLCELEAADYIEFLVKVSIVEIYNERGVDSIACVQRFLCTNCISVRRHSGFAGPEERQLKNPRGQGRFPISKRLLKTDSNRLGVSSSVKSPRHMLGCALSKRNLSQAIFEWLRGFNGIPLLRDSMTRLCFQT